jgi:hypothetical protein
MKPLVFLLVVVVLILAAPQIREVYDFNGNSCEQNVLSS